MISFIKYLEQLDWEAVAYPTKLAVSAREDLPHGSMQSRHNFMERVVLVSLKVQRMIYGVVF